MQLSIVYKLSLSFIILVLISAGVVGGIFYKKTIDLLVKHALEDIAGEVESAGQMLQIIINTHDEDVLFLANTPSIQGLINSYSGDSKSNEERLGYEYWRNNLEKVFESQLLRKASYLSIRYIDANGDELVHVTHKNSKIVHYREDKLQNKKNRVYVKKTLMLPEGSIYVSEINLNREFSLIVEPHQEVKRSATPVYNEDTGELSGLLVITAEIGQQLRSMKKRLVLKKGSDFYITNDQGGYLLHADRNKTYGFDRGYRYRIQEQIPKLARFYLPDNNDRQVILMPDRSNDFKVVNFTKISFDPANPERFIAVVFLQDYESIVSEQMKVLNEVSIWAFLLVLTSAVVGVVLSIQIARPIKEMTQAVNDFDGNNDENIVFPTEQRGEIGVLARSFKSMTQQVFESRNSLHKLNDSLEKKVLERTSSLELSELHQRTILESVADAIITIDDENLITSFNLSAEKMFLYKADEVIGQNVSVLLPDDERKAHDEYTKNKSILHEARVINSVRDLKGKRKDASLFSLELKVTSMKGEQAGYVGVICDITERKRIEKMKNEFISTVSHELRTPLTSIHGALELINNLAMNELPKNISELLKIAANNTNRLLILINDILDIQNIESDQVKFGFKCIDVLPIVEKAIDDNISYMHRHKLRMVLLSPDTKFKIMADKGRIMQVVANLLSNAAKFSTQDRDVELSILSPAKGVVRVSVTNYGATIPEAFQEKLFDKFTQLDSSDTKQKGGTGLGLSISKVIINRHMGELSCVSCDGVTKFYFDLPEC